MSRMRLIWRISLTVVMMATLLSGCQSASNDGEIISKELIKVPGQNPKINIYKIFYYSEGTKVEALLTEPIWSGEYPLLVNLHGGFALEAKSLSNVTAHAYTAEQISKQTTKMIALYPNYRGYGESEGHPQGLASSTRDAQNAIKAAKSMLGKKIKANSTYLIGFSFGGGIALKMASERNDVKAVVAVGSYVGADEYVRWIEENPNTLSPLILTFRTQIEKYKDEASKNNGSLLDRIPHIKAPVLFLQGTGDESAIWQTVQQFADEMEKKKKTVKLVLYPNGNHELNDQYKQQRDQEISQWLEKYVGLRAW